MAREEDINMEADEKLMETKKDKKTNATVLLCQTLYVDKLITKQPGRKYPVADKRQLITTSHW